MPAGEPKKLSKGIGDQPVKAAEAWILELYMEGLLAHKVLSLQV